jgi:hypothetical protein
VAGGTAAFSQDETAFTRNTAEKAGDFATKPSNNITKANFCIAGQNYSKINCQKKIQPVIPRILTGFLPEKNREINGYLLFSCFLFNKKILLKQ